MPSFDRSTPTLTGVLKQRVIPLSGFNGIEWSVASEFSVGGQPTERRFAEVEFAEGLVLSLASGGPKDHPDRDDYSHHYVLTSEVYEHAYTGSAEVNTPIETDGEIDTAAEGNFTQFNEFKGWRYDVLLFNKRELWTDDHVRTIVWRLNSKPGVGIAAIDSVRTFDSEGTMTSETLLTEPTEIVVNAGRRWGARTQSSQTGFTFNVKAGEAEVVLRTFNSGGAYTLPVQTPGTPLPTTAPSKNSVSGQTPELLTHPYIEVVAPVGFARPYYEYLDPVTSLLVPDVQTLAEVRIFLYGEYWVQDIELVNIYEQGWVMHEDGASLSTRLKPPGKSGLSDAFNVIQQSHGTPNAQWR